jgi:transposase
LSRITAAEAAGQKKSLHAAERDTERVRTLRAAFRETVKACEVRQMKFVDESGATLAMTRRYGRAAPGQRVVDSVPVNDGENYTMLAAVGLDGLQAPWVIDGAVNGDIFRCWVRDILGPTLQAGDVVLWDNLAAHKVVGIEELITARGARLLRLSPYSADFNPLEQCWAKIKTFLRQAKARTVDALIDAIKQALDTVTETDIRGWFAHCGYPVR